MDETVIAGSNVGKRLDKIHQAQECLINYKGKNVPVVSKITIGRDKKNDIVLENPIISRFHAEIQKIKNDYFIHDLNSSNGTFVNNERIPKDKYVKLKQDDSILVGKTKLRLLLK